ncbi:LamG domain-containing protein, partial [Candidatus Woesearchaeota archaeon]|nr:LamG domain-containing protein [Candidatus Woesearchaeota archaeon]
MERKNKIKKYEGVYFFLAIALIILSILINLDYTSLNITGRVVEQIYNFSTPLEPSSTRNETDSTSSTLTLPVGTGTSNTTTSTSETMISSSETTSTLELTTTSTILEINNTIRLSNSGFFAQAGIDVINEPQNATENYLGAINIILNFTIGGAYNANENETVRVYGWREGESPYDHLLYKYMHPNGSNIIYNWTAPTANYSDTTGDNGLVVYLKFDNESNFGDNELIEQFGKNSTIFDWSPIHINGTLVQGGAGGSAGGNIARINRTSKFGWGLDFNSSSCTPICTAPGFSYINITQIKLNGSFSWGAWVYSMNTSSEQEVIDKMAGTGTIRTFIDNAGKANCALTGDNGAGATTVTDSVVLGAFNWHHIACVRDVTDDGLWLFVDGKFKNKGQDGTTNNVTTNIKIGLAQGGSSPFNGTIDEVAVWNRSLGLLEIANLYRLGFGRYYWKVNVTNLSGTGVESATQTFTIDLPPYVPYGKWDTQCGFVDLPKKNVTVDFTTNISSSGRYYHYINTSQAFMLMSAGDSATDTTTVRMTDFTITGNITNSTTLWFERGSTNYVGKVTWCLIEGPMKVQSGFTNITNVSNALRYSEVTLGNQVNSSQSVVFINTRTDEPAASNTQLNRVLAEFLNDTQLRFSVASALNGINISISWYAVEFANDVSIQKGYSNVASALQSNASINPVNVTRAFVYNTWNISNQNGVIEMFTTNLTNSTSIQFQRGSTTGTAIIHYSVIELPNGSVVQWGSNSSATGTRVVFNSTINPATNLSRAFPFVTWKATTGGTHFPSDFWEYNLTNLSSQLSIVLDRFLGGGNYQFVWQIIEFNESSSTTFFGDSTTTTSSTTSSSSTLPHANLTLYLRNSSFTGLYQNITAFTNDSVNITSKDEYPADVNMTLFVINYTGGKYNQNTSKSFLQNITTFWTNGSFLVNITWEGNT